MNYVSAVYGVVVTIIILDWLLRGKRSYRGQSLRHEQTTMITERARADNVVR